MEFYRIEKENHGPYNPSIGTPSIMEYLEKYQSLDCSDADGSFSNYIRIRPTYLDDPIIRSFLYDIVDRKDYIYGFNSLDKLLQWFDAYGQMQFLKDWGYILNVYETEDYCISEYQMIANKNSIKLVESIAL